MLALLLVTVAVFWKVPGADFVQWDDDINIYRNPFHGDLSWARIIWMFTDLHYVMYYAPLSWLTLSIIYEFSGLHPFGYHFTSLLLHGANTLLVYVIIRRLLALYYAQLNAAKETTIMVCAGAGALLWSVHPLRVEAVAWATGLSHLLAALFALLSLFCYLNTQGNQGRRNRRWFLILSFVVFLAGIISYPVVMAFPAVLVIIDFFVMRRFSAISDGPLSRAALAIWLEKLPFFFVSAAVLVFTLYRRSAASGLWSAPLSLHEFSIMARIMQAFYVWSYFLWKPLVPLHLAPTYWSLVVFSPFEARFILSCVAIVGTTAFLAIKSHRFPGLLALWLCYLCLLTPMLGVTEHPHYTSDRYSYLPSVLLSIVVAAALLRMWQQPAIRLVGLAICSAGALVCGTLSFKQTLVWQDTVTLFQHVLTTLDDEKARADIHWRLGIFLRSTGKLAQAESELRKAVEVVPNSAAMHCDLGLVFFLQDHLDQAFSEFNAAAAADPSYWGAQVGRASVFLKKRQLPAVVSAYREALRANANLPGVLNDLAWIEATAADPSLRNGDEAVAAALRACQLTGFNNSQFVLTLAAAYAESGEFDSAVRTAQQAAELASTQRDTRQQRFCRQLETDFRSRKPFRIEEGAGRPGRPEQSRPP